MSGKEVIINFNGTKITLNEKINTKAIESESKRRIATIFDKNLDGTLDSSELETASKYSSGIFKEYVSPYNERGYIYSTNEDLDKDGKADSTTTWLLRDGEAIANYRIRNEYKNDEKIRTVREFYDKEGFVDTEYIEVYQDELAALQQNDYIKNKDTGERELRRTQKQIYGNELDGYVMKNYERKNLDGTPSVDATLPDRCSLNMFEKMFDDIVKE